MARKRPDWVYYFMYWYGDISFIGKLFFWWIILLSIGIITTGIVLVVLGLWFGWVVLGASALALTIAGGIYVEENGW